MKQRYRLFRRSNGKNFYIQDNVTGKQESLHTKERSEALALLHARNQAARQPELNIQLARAYLAGSDPESLKRTWQSTMDELVKLKSGSTHARYERAMKSKVFDPIRKLFLLHTQAEDFSRLLERGGSFANDNLRRLHNFALDMNWLPRPVLPRRQWPPLKYGEKRAITRLEHQSLVERESTSAWKAFLQRAPLFIVVGSGCSRVLPSGRCGGLPGGRTSVSFHPRSRTVRPA